MVWYCLLYSSPPSFSESNLYNEDIPSSCARTGLKLVNQSTMRQTELLVSGMILFRRTRLFRVFTN